jgi:hypothetical protein
MTDYSSVYSICGIEVEHAANAWPVIAGGSCCLRCDETIVRDARLRLLGWSKPDKQRGPD